MSYWEVKVVDGLSDVCVVRMPGNLSEKEICEASFRRGTIGKNVLLETRRDAKLIMVGENPYVVAEKKSEEINS